MVGMKDLGNVWKEAISTLEGLLQRFTSSATTTPWLYSPCRTLAFLSMYIHIYNTYKLLRTLLLAYILELYKKEYSYTSTPTLGIHGLF